MITIDIDGSDGNAFVLMSYATRFAKQMGLDPIAICREMRSNDYLTVLEVFQKYFKNVARLKCEGGLKKMMDHCRSLRKEPVKDEIIPMVEEDDWDLILDDE